MLNLCTMPRLEIFYVTVYNLLRFKNLWGSRHSQHPCFFTFLCKYQASFHTVPLFVLSLYCITLRRLYIQ
jgi:hypothetical protein